MRDRFAFLTDRRSSRRINRKEERKMIVDVLRIALLSSVLCTVFEPRSNVGGRVIFANVTGNVVLGGLFPVHRKGSGGESCGEIQIEDGIQPLEAMLYTVERINNDPTMLPGIQLGALAFDTCDNPGYALEQAFYFVKGLIARGNQYGEQEYRCEDRSAPKFMNGGFDDVIAMLGAQSSSVTIQVASVLALFSIPQISYMATSPFLSSKEKFPQFFRTVPSDVNQARAMLEILRRFEWSYASIVYSDSEYGDHGYETLVSLATEYSICFTAPHRIQEDRFTDEDYDNVVRTIADKTGVRVVVLFAEKSATLRVLASARRMGLDSRFVWLGSDSWPDRKDEERRGNVSELEGALAVQPLYAPLSGFDRYFTNLTLEHEKRNPWFREFWYKYHGCEYPTERSAAAKITGEEMDRCADPSLRIDRTNGYKQRRFLHFVRDAVYAVAYALRDAQIDMCGRRYFGICERMRSMDGETFSRYLTKVSFKDEAGNGFGFVDEVDGPPRYSILNFRRTSNGTHQWMIVGNYTLNEHGRAELRLDREKMGFRGEIDFPDSSCSKPCDSDRIMVRVKEDPCCWRCQSCGLYRFRVDEHRCEDCKWGTRPTENGTSCEPIPEEFVDHSNPWAIAAMTVAVLGISLTGFVSSVFWRYGETPMIKASGRELSFLLLVGAFACFSMTFAIVAKPSAGSCAVVRFGIGFCYTLCYAALATKINRIHRIFNDPGPSPRKRRYTSPRSQLTIAGILTLAEVAFDAAWLLKEPPAVTNSYPTREANVRICRGSEDASYVIGLAYPFLLTVASTFYAIKTRKCPEGFNETRRIAFANYATIVLWLAFVPLYLASISNVIRAITLALSLSLNGLVQLLCLFLPKVYVVLTKPEKNTRELVMSRPLHVGGGSSNPTAMSPAEASPRQALPSPSRSRAPSPSV
ncbi:metabotropic glutamate receptor 6 [Lasioglossum baleicum]|uniref:metabotropic glutamate receptor 6 n=1 Tax=Lasioglossum baleicum TaxID=434251 RepID=UPI003FCCC8FC